MSGGAALARASAAGLNVQAVLDVSSLIREVPALVGHARWPSLILLGSTGGALWDALHAAGYADHPDPIDAFAASVVATLRSELDGQSQLLWPDPDGAPLAVLALGRAAGWAHPSPLGLGVHPRHGLWVGYRAALLVEHALPALREVGAGPCESCLDRPCVTACPVGAVAADLDLGVCFAERTRDGAACGSACRSRLACPVGVESQYGAAQIAHHQRAGNRVFARWSAR